MPAKISRADYASTFGPTVGDRVRLADTCLFIQVERDLTVYGEEAVFGDGKVVRDGMGQGQTSWAEGAPDTVITNALILDHSGIVKADVSIRDGIIGTIGKAGNPAMQSGVTIPIGPGTEIIAAEGKILTAGGVDTEVRFVNPRQIEEAFASGITTMLGGGTGPTTGDAASAATPGAWHIGKMIDATDAFPVNIGFAGKGSAATPAALIEQLAGGACALALHEVWGATPAAIDCCLDVADEHDVQVVMRLDTLNEAGFIEDVIATLKGRTVHAAGGDRPDTFRLAELSNVLPSTAVRVGGRGSDGLVAVEDVLHDLGALSIIGSGEQATGRTGETIRHAWQTADTMKRRRGPLTGDTPRSDNVRAKRYIAKYTINPAIAHGVADHVGSVEMGKLADLVLWSPAFFGVRPDLVLKGGIVASAAIGEAGTSVASRPPRRTLPMFGTFAGARVGACLTFVSQLALDKGLELRLRTQRRLVGVKATRGAIGKASMVYNDSMPAIRVDPRDNKVEADGEALVCEPVGELAMAQRYFLF